jgi:hypothetical protein
MTKRIIQAVIISIIICSAVHAITVTPPTIKPEIVMWGYIKGDPNSDSGLVDYVAAHSIGFGYPVAASDSSDNDKARALYKCSGTDDDVEVQTAIDRAATSGGRVFLAAGTYNFSSSVVLKSGVWIEGATVTMSPKGISDLTATILNGTIVTASGITAFVGNNIYGGGIENICISGCNGLSLGKQNQFGPQFWTINRIFVFNPPDFGVRLYNFGQVHSDQLAVFSMLPSPVPVKWTGIDLISENDTGNTAAINTSTDEITVSRLSYNENDVVFWLSDPATLPTAAGTVISNLTPYYVINVNAAANTFKLARTPGGTAIDFTGTGTSPIIGGCDFQPGNSIFCGTYVLWNTKSDFTDRALRGIYCRTVNPVYGGVTHTGIQLNYLTFIRPQVNMFGFTGTLANCNRINFASAGTNGSAICYGFNVLGGDFEGRNQNALRLEYTQGGSFDIAGLSSKTDFDSGLYIANSTFNTIRGNTNLTLEIVDNDSAATCVGAGIFGGLKSGTTRWIKGVYFDNSTGIVQMRSQLAGYSSAIGMRELSSNVLTLDKTHILPTSETLIDSQNIDRKSVV